MPTEVGTRPTVPGSTFPCRRRSFDGSLSFPWAIKPLLFLLYSSFSNRRRQPTIVQLPEPAGEERWSALTSVFPFWGTPSTKSSSPTPIAAMSSPPPPPSKQWIAKANAHKAATEHDTDRDNSSMVAQVSRTRRLHQHGSHAASANSAFPVILVPSRGDHAGPERSRLHCRRSEAPGRQRYVSAGDGSHTLGYNLTALGSPSSFCRVRDAIRGTRQR